jgi:hypothetical protein
MQGNNKILYSFSRITYSKGRRDVKHHFLHLSRHTSVWSSMRIDTLEALRLAAAHHPSTESDTAPFCPLRMGRKSIHHAMLSQLATSQMPDLVAEMASKLWPVKFFIYKINQEWPSIHVPI